MGISYTVFSTYLYEYLQNKKLGRKGKTNSERGVLTYLVPSVSFIIEEREKANSSKEKFPEGGVHLHCARLVRSIYLSSSFTCLLIKFKYKKY